MQDPQPTIDALFRRCAEQYPRRDFLRRVVLQPEGGQHIEARTFAQAACRVAATMQHLEKIGLRSGDTVVVWADDAVESIYFFLACFHLGVIPVPLSPSFSLDYVIRVAQRVHARLCCGLPPEVAKLRERDWPTLCLTPSADVAGLTAAQALTQLRAAGMGRQPDAPLIITPTSGSTGEAKLPMWSHRSMERAADNLRIALGWAEDRAERALLVNAPTHGLGLTLVSGALRVAATLCVPSRIDVDTPLDEVRAFDFSYSFMTPRVLQSLHSQYVASDPVGASPLFGPHARAIAFAGAPPPLELFPVLAQQGVNPIDVWGSSETGNIACSDRGQWASGYLRPFPGIEVRVGEGNNELALRSSHFFLGYHGDAELTRQAFTADGYYRTGDAGEVLANGQIRLVGRTRDVFNTFEGSNIWPGRIETMIERHPWARQAVLVGDRRPFCSALIVVARESHALGDEGPLDPDRHAALYEAARADLQRMNAELEAIEQVRRFWLFAQPFSPEVYLTVGAASKIRRDRALVAEVHRAHIKALYEPTFPSAATVSG